MLNKTKLLIVFTICTTLGACSGSNSAQTTSDDSNSKEAQKQSADERSSNSGSHSVDSFNATLNGKPHSWKVNSTLSHWNAGRDKTPSAATIVATAASGNEYPGNLEFSIIGSGDTWRGSEIYVYRGQPDVFSYSTKHDGSIDFNVSDYSMVDGFMHITGTFSATLPAVSQAGGEPNLSDTLTLKGGTFEIAVPPQGR